MSDVGNANLPVENAIATMTRTGPLRREKSPLEGAIRAMTATVAVRRSDDRNHVEKTTILESEKVPKRRAVKAGNDPNEIMTMM